MLLFLSNFKKFMETGIKIFLFWSEKFWNPWTASFIMNFLNIFYMF